MSKTKREVGRRGEKGLGEPTGGWGSNPDRLAPRPLRPTEVLQLPTSGQYLQIPKMFGYTFGLESLSQAIWPTKLNPNPGKSFIHKEVHRRKMTRKWFK